MFSSPCLRCFAALLVLTGFAFAKGNTTFRSDFGTYFFMDQQGVPQMGVPIERAAPGEELVSIKLTYKPQEQTGRGKLKGSIINQSEAKTTIEDHPLIEQGIEDGLDPVFGEGFEVEQTFLKVSKKGKTRGSFSGVADFL